MDYRLRRINFNLDNYSKDEFTFESLIFGDEGGNSSIQPYNDPIQERLNERFGSNEFDWITFSPFAIIVQDESIDTMFPYDQVNNLEIRFRQNLYELGFNAPLVSIITFTMENKLFEYFFSSYTSKVIKVCKFLFHKKVAFKEYHSHLRVHLGKRLNYKEIQELKKLEYFEW